MVYVIKIGDDYFTGDLHDDYAGLSVDQKNAKRFTKGQTFSDEDMSITWLFGPDARFVRLTHWVDLNDDDVNLDLRENDDDAFLGI